MRTVSLNTIKQQDVTDVLHSGGLVVAPSDTVYGLLVDATNEAAVRKLLAFKNRPIGKPISVFVGDMTLLSSTVNMSDSQNKTLARFLPGPFTVVLPSKHTVNKLLESERGTLGVRIPDYPFVNSLVKAYGKPVTATSANLSGKSHHYSVETFLKQLPESKQELIDLIIDGGKLPYNLPSTIVDISGSELKVMRKGDIIWKDENTYVSASPAQTRKIAAHLLATLRRHAADKPVVLFLEGDLGAGKTEFVRGMAEHLGITNIVSPTYVIYYEYPIDQKYGYSYLYHFDLYQVEQENEFEHLGLEEMMKPGRLLCVEWGEKAASLLPMFRDKATIYYITISYTGPDSREITIKT